MYCPKGAGGCLLHHPNSASEPIDSWIPNELKIRNRFISAVKVPNQIEFQWIIQTVVISEKCCGCINFRLINGGAKPPPGTPKIIFDCCTSISLVAVKNGETHFSQINPDWGPGVGKRSLIKWQLNGNVKKTTASWIGCGSIGCTTKPDSFVRTSEFTLPVLSPSNVSVNSGSSSSIVCA
jgi:hypothetical protein